jgi:hypothetical protein
VNGDDENRQESQAQERELIGYSKDSVVHEVLQLVRHDTFAHANCAR